MRKEESVAGQVWQEFSPREGEELAFREDSRYGYLVTVTIGSGGEEFDVDPDQSLGELVSYLAGRMQTIIMEERQRMVPDYPLHPAEHPLDIGVVDDTTAWVCPSIRRLVPYMQVTIEGA